MMAIYLHARRFPHLSGIDDDRIRDLLRRGLVKRPGLVRLMQIRNRAGFVLMVLAAMALDEWVTEDLGLALMIAGSSATVLLLAWNLVWVNRVVFPITKEELELDSDSERSSGDDTER